MRYLALASLVAGILLLSAHPVLAQGCADYNSYFHMIGQATAPDLFIDHAEGVALTGDRVYVADGIGYPTAESYFYSVDIGDPAHPVSEGQIELPGFVRDVAAIGQYALVACGYEGLVTVDVSDPVNPAPVDTFTVDYAWGIHLTPENLAYVCGYDSQLNIIDYSDPANPTPVGSYPTPNISIYVEVVDDYAYVTQNGGNFMILDVSEPDAPVLAGGLTLPGNFQYGLAIQDTLCFVTDTYEGLHILSINDPTAPVLLGSIDIEYARSVAVREYRAFVGTGGMGMAVVDFSDPANPALTGNISLSANVSEILLEGNRMVLANGNAGVVLCDATNTQLASTLASAATLANSSQLGVHGDYAYLAGVNYAGGATKILEICDISTPGSPGMRGSVELPDFPGDPVIRGSYAYVPCYTSGLQVVNVSNPDAPSLGALVTTGGAEHAAIRDDLLYLAAGANGLMIFDLSDPANPAPRGIIDTPGHAEEVAVQGDFAYIADGTEGLRVVSIANPDAPALRGFYHFTGWYRSVSVKGNYAYVTEDGSSLRVIDIVNPDAPFLERLIDVPSSTSQVRVKGSHIYLSTGVMPNGGQGIWLLDMVDPAWPLWHGYLSTEGDARSFTTAGDYIYMASGNAGLEVAARHCDVTPVLLSHFELDPAGGLVRVRWEAQGEGLDFRLAVAGGDIAQTWELAYESSAPGRYEALDRNEALAEGGDFAYTLFGREAGEDWQLLRRESVQLDAVPRITQLQGAYPNPFNPHTTLAFTLAGTQAARLTLFDATGRRVAVLLDEVLEAGYHERVWQGVDDKGRALASGIYFAQLETEGVSESLRLILLR